MMPPPRNILLFHLGALGDFLLTTPLALALARIHPQSRVIYVTHAQKGALAEKLLGIESTNIELGWHHLYSDAGQLPPPARKLVENAHTIYSFIAAPDEPWCRQVRRLAPRADLCSLRPTPPPDYPGHYTDHLLSQLTARRAAHEALRQMLQAIQHRGLVASTPRPRPRIITLHPGSGSPAKCWPPDHFLALARRLRDAGHRVKILLGETELDRWPAGQIDAFAAVADLRRPATCMDLFHELQDSSLFLGNDSGPAHLAGLLGLPTFILFGPTNPALWHPLGPSIHTLHHNPLHTLSADPVHQWITPALA
jgi:ADP-heptose:LPS heptosyltransferase